MFLPTGKLFVVNEQELKEGLATLRNRYVVEDHLLPYLDNDRIRFLGDLPLSALAPLVSELIVKRLVK